MANQVSPVGATSSGLSVLVMSPARREMKVSPLVEKATGVSPVLDSTVSKLTRAPKRRGT